jgi:hypothetical protein
MKLETVAIARPSHSLRQPPESSHLEPLPPRPPSSSSAKATPDMSTPRLAIELMQHVVDIIAEDTTPESLRLRTLAACSATTSALLAASQRHLFRSVSVYHHLTGTDRRQGAESLWEAGPEFQTLCATTPLVIRSITGSPRLASYVKDVKFRFSGYASHRSGPVLDAILQLINIESLFIGFYPAPIDRGDNASPIGGDVQSTILHIMQRPSIKKLTLESIRWLPPQLIFGAPGLHELVLHGSGSRELGYLLR